MPRLLPATGLLALTALLLAGPTLGQGPAPAAPAAAPAIPPSAFDGYRRYDAQPVTPWRESNDTVGRIGGWKVYAREAQQPDPAPAAQAGTLAPAAPAAPAARSEASPAPGAPAPAGSARGHAH